MKSEDEKNNLSNRNVNFENSIQEESKPQRLVSHVRFELQSISMKDID